MDKITGTVSVEFTVLEYDAKSDDRDGPRTATMDEVRSFPCVRSAQIVAETGIRTRTVLAYLTVETETRTLSFHIDSPYSFFAAESTIEDTHAQAGAMACGLAIDYLEKEEKE